MAACVVVVITEGTPCTLSGGAALTAMPGGSRSIVSRPCARSEVRPWAWPQERGARPGAQRRTASARKHGRYRRRAAVLVVESGEARVVDRADRIGDRPAIAVIP